MFDIGWSEILLVLVVALVVVGPKDMPRLIRSIGRCVGKARRMAEQFRAGFDELTRETELDELRREISALRAHNPVTRFHDEINRTIQRDEAPTVAAMAEVPRAAASDASGMEDLEAPVAAPARTEPEPASDPGSDAQRQQPPAAGITPTGP